MSALSERLNEIPPITIDAIEAGILADTLRTYAEVQDQMGDHEVASMNRERADNLDEQARETKRQLREAFAAKEGK